MLKKVNVTQFRYGSERVDCDGEIVDLQFVEFYRSGRLVRISLDEIDIVGKIISGLSDVYRMPLEYRYLRSGGNDQHAVEMGIGLSTFERRLKSAKAMFGIVWASVTRKVVQRGVMMNGLNKGVDKCDGPSVNSV